MATVGIRTFVEWDDLGHAAGWFVLTLAGRWAWQRAGPSITFAAAIGIVLEVLQPHVGRSRSWTDLAADISGIVIATITWNLIRRRRHSGPGPPDT